MANINSKIINLAIFSPQWYLLPVGHGVIVLPARIDERARCERAEIPLSCTRYGTFTRCGAQCPKNPRNKVQRGTEPAMLKSDFVFGPYHRIPRGVPRTKIRAQLIKWLGSCGGAGFTPHKIWAGLSSNVSRKVARDTDLFHKIPAGRPTIS